MVGAVYLLCLSDGPLASGPGVPSEKTLVVFSAATRKFSHTFSSLVRSDMEGLLHGRSC